MKIKLKIPFQILALLMAALMFHMPFVTLAQQNSVRAEAIAAAERDAQNYTNKGLWFLGGGCCGFGVISIARRHEPSLPAGQLLGKSPEYVAFYAAAYREKAKELQTNSAIAGCVIGALTGAIFIGVMILTEESSSSSDYYSY